MTFGIAQRHLDALRQVFARHATVDQVLVFGSRARGTARPGSDIDLAVMAPRMDDAEFTTLWNEIDALPILFKIDLLHWDRITNPALKQNAAREGRPLSLPATAKHTTASPT
ncbi:nucleotidyltransferase domain-containing protein [Sphaerotilus sp.]|uniref:nucleotidyltransferase family protein n=1 Tax=Sphaerotilus sp. TaxID=2093942 RepID=UPI002ACDB632|nr:nucleotidyltransferase domain-containing protein [Sphaerotilus sp.]MDZ7858615.1 nucleotidyltransferase domain-containing protein [Sphaerotilus sp.]